MLAQLTAKIHKNFSTVILLKQRKFMVRKYLQRVHKTAVWNALPLIIGSLLVPIRDVNLKLLQAEGWSSGF